MRVTQALIGAAAFGQAFASLELFESNSCANQGCHQYECQHYCGENQFGRFNSFVSEALEQISKFRQYNPTCYKCCCEPKYEYYPPYYPPEEDKCEVGRNGLENPGFGNGFDPSPWFFPTGEGAVIKADEETIVFGQPRKAQSGDYFFDIQVPVNTVANGPPRIVPTATLTQYAKVCSKKQEYELRFFYQAPEGENSNVDIYIDDVLVGTLEKENVFEWTLVTFTYPADMPPPPAKKGGKNTKRGDDKHNKEERGQEYDVKLEIVASADRERRCDHIYVDSFTLSAKDKKTLSIGPPNPAAA